MIRRRRSIRGVLIRAIVIIISASIIIISRSAPRTEMVATTRTVSVIGIAIRSASISVPVLVVIPVPVIVIIVITARVGSLSLVLFSAITVTNKMSSASTIITNRRFFHSRSLGTVVGIINRRGRCSLCLGQVNTKLSNLVCKLLNGLVRIGRRSSHHLPSFPSEGYFNSIIQGTRNSSLNINTILRAQTLNIKLFNKISRENTIWVYFLL